jgi:hypothetical protein
MTKAQLAKRVKLWQKRLPDLGLGHWRITIDIVENPEGLTTALAACTPSLYYDSARIEFATRACDPSVSERAVDETIVHELIHLVLRDYAEATHGLCDTVPSSVEELYHDRLRYTQENAVEKLAVTLVSCYY